MAFIDLRADAAYGQHLADPWLALIDFLLRTLTL